MKEQVFYKGYRLVLDCLGNWYCECFEYYGKLNEIKKYIDNL